MEPNRTLHRRRNLLKAASAASLCRSLGIPLSTLATSTYAQQANGERVLTMLGQIEPPALLSFVDSSSVIFSGRSTESLLSYDRNMNPQPLLATKWTVSPDGLVYTFTLRRGVKWHDGQDFTSQDVAFSILTQKQFHSRGRSTYAQVLAVDTPDPFTAVIRLAKPTPYLLKAFGTAESPIVPKHRYATGSPLTNANNTAPIGTGPFIFKEWVRGSHVIWVRNPNYWDKDFPKIDRLIGKFIDDPAARAIALETGSVDIGYRTPVPYRDLPRLRQNSELQFDSTGYEYNPPNCIVVETNLSDPALGQLAVRQAIAHCIDREAICRVVFSGAAAPSASPVVPGLKEFHLAEKSPYPYDVAKAEALLESAGFPRKGSAGRIRLTLDFTTDEQRILAEYLRAALSRAGIMVDIRGQDMGSLVRRVYTDRQYQLHLTSVSNLFDPQVGVKRFYWSKNIIKGIPFSNGTGYANPAVDQLLDETDYSLNHQERVSKWHEIQRIVMRDVPSIPIASAGWLTIVRKRVRATSMNADGFEGSLSRIELAA